MSPSELAVAESPAVDVAPVRAASRRRRWLRTGTVVFACAFAFYVAVGAVLVFVYHVMMGDAVARVANGSYALFSRDPHLGSIGFVWPPLPTLVLLPLLPFKALFPALVSRGFAGNIASAAFMAGAVVQLNGTLRDRGTARWIAWPLTAAFALHPMIIFYGANGMTEAPLMFFLLTAVRGIGRWLETVQLRPLIMAGAALGCAYLTRYEAAAAALASMALVTVASYRRAAGEGRRRRLVAAGDAVILGAPFIFAAVAWAVASWVIVGSPFQAFSSVYGNASYVGIDAAEIPDGAGIMARQIVALQPLVLVALGAAAARAFRRRDPWVLSVAAVVGAALAFQMMAFVRGGTYGFFRYYILTVPLGVLLAAAIAPGRRARAVSAEAGVRGFPAIRSSILGLAVLGLVLPSLPAAAVAMADRRLAPQEAPLRVLAEPGRTLHQRRTLVEPFTVERDVAHYLDALGLPDGAVLVDVAFGFPIVIESVHPRQFIIPPDEDFEAALAAPRQFGVRYFLATSGEGLGRIDAINRAFPKGFESGRGFGVMVREFRGNGAPWRLYEVAG